MKIDKVFQKFKLSTNLTNKIYFPNHEIFFINNKMALKIIIFDPSCSSQYKINQKNVL